MLVWLIMPDMQKPSVREFMEKLYLEQRELMYIVARRYVRSAADVDEVMMESLLRLLDKHEKLTTLDCNMLKAYVVSTVKNTAINYVKRNAHEQPHADDGIIENIASQSESDEGLLADERAQTVRKALAELQPADRMALEMKYFLEYDDCRIAHELGVKPDSVRQRLRRARNRLHTILSNGGFDDE